MGVGIWEVGVSWLIPSPTSCSPIPVSDSEQGAKRAVGEAAAALAEEGMRLGLGTGSTTAEAIRALGARVREEGLGIVGVPTSFAAERLAREHGVPLATLDDLEPRGDGTVLDLALDGADEVFVADDGAIHLVKGRGAAMARERVVAAEAARFVVLADPSKLVDRLGERMPVPVEVLPMAAAPAARALEGLGGEPTLRMGERKDGPVVTDQGLWVYDVRFGTTPDPDALAAAIRAVPGVLDHGLFLGMASAVLIGAADGTVRELQVPSS